MTSTERHEGRYQRRKAKRCEKRKQLIGQCDNYNAVFSYDNLWKSHKDCQANVGWKSSTRRYKFYGVRNVATTYLALQKEIYKSRGFIAFDVIERGHTRHILSVHISERVVQRCFCDNSLVKVFSSSFIYDNSACLKGKGVDFAKDRAECHLHRYYRQYGTNDGYVFAFDFSGFFEHIRHAPLYATADQKYTDVRLSQMYRKFISCFAEYNRKVGRHIGDYEVELGLGSQSSQVSAVEYPDKIDHHIKEHLRAKYYARFMDDGYIISPSKEYLQQCLSELKIMCAELGIKLNEKKTRITTLKHGFVFLKTRYILTDTGAVKRIPTKDSRRRECRKMKVFVRWVGEGKMTIDDAWQSYQAWRSHLLRDDAHKTIRSMNKRFEEKFGGYINDSIRASLYRRTRKPTRRARKTLQRRGQTNRTS